MQVKQIIQDEVYLKNFSRVIYKNDLEMDLPYFAGKYQELIPTNLKKNAKLSTPAVPFVNESMLFNEIIEIGSKGLYYLVLQKGYKIDKLLCEPEEIKIDLYIHKNGRLIYSFYNPTRKKNITLKGKVSEDYDKIVSRLDANLDDPVFREYFLKLAKESFDKELKIPEFYPEVMTAIQVAAYLNVEEKTIRKWTSEKKIPVTKIGGTVRYRKEDIDSFLESQTHRPKKNNAR